MPWIVWLVSAASIALCVARRRRDLVFVAPLDPISVVHLRLAHRPARAKLALRAASRLLQ